MLAALARNLWRRPWWWITIWVALAVVLGVTGPSAERVARVEPPSMLPDDQPYSQAVQLERRAFPEVASRSRTVLIFERPAGLTPADYTYLADLTRRLMAAGARDDDWRVQSPITEPHLRSRLVSTDGQAAMIVVRSQVNYVTHRSQMQVNQVESIARETLPAGLALEITGEGGMGRDLATAATQAYHRTTWVTVLALLVILAFVYRAPAAALVPLLAIAVSVYAAIAALHLLTLAGWTISDTEKTFVVVLLFGSGIDFSLFWMWRYREEQARGGQRPEAFVTAQTTTGPAVLTSAATTIVGFIMLTSADLLPSHNAGRALAFALVIAALAAVTLVPAISRLMGSALFWPRRQPSPNDGRRTGLWDALAGAVVRRPGLVVGVVLIVLIWPTFAGLRTRYQYDALGVIPDGSSAARGRAIARRHFSAAELFSWTCLIQSPAAVGDLPTAVENSRRLAETCASLEGISDIWSLHHPLGQRLAASAGLMRSQARAFYVSTEPPCLRLEFMMNSPPLSPAAMYTCATSLELIEGWAARQLGDDAVVRATGLTPYILNIKSVSDADQKRVMLLAIVAIGLIVLVWVRDLPMAIAMLAATLAVYAATLGVTDAFFRHVVGSGGIDWKVKLFLFVVLVAVGQDYNIFVVSRIRQECRDHPPPEAVRRAVVRTGSVISSCGLIMAATLGSLAATGLSLHQQLGFAFAFGVLLDTFVVRPLLVPAFYLLSRRRAWK